MERLAVTHRAADHRPATLTALELHNHTTKHSGGARIPDVLFAFDDFLVCGAERAQDEMTRLQTLSQLVLEKL